MNMAKIKAISNQAREFASTKDPLDLYVVAFDEDKFEAKFAELIVKECAKVATECDMQYKVGWMIKTHFGVEETPTASL